MLGLLDLCVTRVSEHESSGKGSRPSFLYWYLLFSYCKYHSSSCVPYWFGTIKVPYLRILLSIPYRYGTTTVDTPWILTIYVWDETWCLYSLYFSSVRQELILVDWCLYRQRVLQPQEVVSEKHKHKIQTGGLPGFVNKTRVSRRLRQEVGTITSYIRRYTSSDPPMTVWTWNILFLDNKRLPVDPSDITCLISFTQF